MPEPRTTVPPDLRIVPPVPEPPALVVTPAPESRLDALAARFALLKPQVEELTRQLKEVTDGLKAETTQACPTGTTDMLLTSPHLPRPLRLHRVLSWRLDAKAMKEQEPETYVRFAKQSTTWRLDAT